MGSYAREREREREDKTNHIFSKERFFENRAVIYGVTFNKPLLIGVSLPCT